MLCGGCSGIDSAKEIDCPPWDKANGAAIDTCDYFLIAVSANAVTSIHVGEEIHYALSRERERGRDWIMPVLLDSTDLSQVNWRLGRRQYREVTTKTGKADFEKALQDIASRQTPPS